MMRHGMQATAGFFLNFARRVSNRGRGFATDCGYRVSCGRMAIRMRLSSSVARHQEAKSWELRVAISLARLWQSQDKRQETYDLLAPMHGWFTEGLDTADLQEAKALLSELAQ